MFPGFSDGIEKMEQEKGERQDVSTASIDKDPTDRLPVEVTEKSRTWGMTRLGGPPGS